MDDYQKMIVDFVDEAIRVSGAETRTGLARMLGFAATTITRIDKRDSKNLMSLKTAWAISALTGVPIPQVSSSNPSVGERINDADEAAWVGFWRRLDDADRQVMFRTHRIDPPDSPRRKIA